MGGGGAAGLEFSDAEGQREEEMRVIARFLTQTALAPEVSSLPADTRERVLRLSEAALDDLSPAERRAVLSIRGTPSASQASAACEFGVKVYEAMLLAPDAEAARMFKSLQASGLQRAAF